ncbi:MAG: hypothetical protein JSU68_01765, partial [Phycisphaerales bacterium]
MSPSDSRRPTAPSARPDRSSLSSKCGLVILACSFIILAVPSRSPAGAQLRLGSPDDCQLVATEAVLPAGQNAELEFRWGLNLADLDLDGRVTLNDFSTFANCFAGAGGLRPSGCSTDDFRASDLDADGDVDDADKLHFQAAHRTQAPFVLEEILWKGADEIEHTTTGSRAALDTSTPATVSVAAEAQLFDSITGRRVTRARRATFHILDIVPEQISIGFEQPFTTLQEFDVPVGPPPPMAFRVFVHTDNPAGPSRIAPGDLVYFDIGVRAAQCDLDNDP